MSSSTSDSRLNFQGEALMELKENRVKNSRTGITKVDGSEPPHSPSPQLPGERAGVRGAGRNSNRISR
jgi:hypothetical protein